MEQKAKIAKVKIVKVGNSYGVRIPKALIDTEVLKMDGEYDIVITTPYLNMVRVPVMDFLNYGVQDGPINC